MNFLPPNIEMFFAYLGVSLVLLCLGAGAFMLFTPYRDLDILRAGSGTERPEQVCAAEAVAYDLGGKLTGLGLVLASAIFHAARLADLAVWGLLGIVMQVLVFYLVELLIPFKVTREIPQGNVAMGIFSSRISVVIGLIMAALIS